VECDPKTEVFTMPLADGQPLVCEALALNHPEDLVCGRSGTKHERRLVRRLTAIEQHTGVFQRSGPGSRDDVAPADDPSLMAADRLEQERRDTAPNYEELMIGVLAGVE
jgi:hypothetical protein